jgi:predicted nucleic acid-binding protein
LGAVYLDTSALGRALLGESDAKAITDALRRFDQTISSRLLQAELRRLASRREMVDRANLLLASVALLPVDSRTLDLAETLTPHTLGTLDAIHLATVLLSAEALDVEALMTYDKPLVSAAREHGIEVVAPD